MYHGLAGSCDVATPTSTPSPTPFPTAAPSAPATPTPPSTGAAESGAVFIETNLETAESGAVGCLFISNSFGLSALIETKGTKGAGEVPGNAGYTEFTQRQQNGKRRRSTIRWSACVIDAIDDAIDDVHCCSLMPAV